MNNYSYICRREEKMPIKIRVFSQDLSHGHQEKSGTFAAIMERMKEFRQALIRRYLGLSALENLLCYLFLRGKKNPPTYVCKRTILEITAISKFS